VQNVLTLLTRHGTVAKQIRRVLNRKFWDTLEKAKEKACNRVRGDTLEKFKRKG